jgi:hypothetical protein
MPAEQRWRRGVARRMAGAAVVLALLLGLRQLPTLDRAGAAPSWWLVYAANGDLWQTDGQRIEQLTFDGHVNQPAVGDDTVAFVRRTGNASDIWLASPDLGPHEVTHNSSPVVAANTWAAQPVLGVGQPNHLLMLSDRDKTTTAIGGLAVWDLDVARGAASQLTHPPDYTGGDQDVTANPANPGQIVFTRYRYDAQGQLVEELEWLDRDTGRLAPLTPPDQPSRQAAFAPDGQRLAFVQGTGPDQKLVVGHLVAETPTAVPRLADPQPVAGGSLLAQPVWRADGAALAYIALVKRSFELWALPISPGPDGQPRFGQPARLAATPSVDATSRPVWLSDEAAANLRQWLEVSPAAEAAGSH